VYKDIVLSPQQAKEMIDQLGADFAALPDPGNAEKIAAMLGAIAVKCGMCKIDSAGRAFLEAVATCTKEDCPLAPFGPSVYLHLLAKLGHLTPVPGPEGWQ